jgi:hypothetical protein
MKNIVMSSAVETSRGGTKDVARDAPGLMHSLPLVHPPGSVHVARGPAAPFFDSAPLRSE